MKKKVFRAALACAATVLAASCAVPPRAPKVVPAGASETGPAVLAPPAGRFLKRKVLIQRFSNETTYGKSILLGQDVMGKQASDILTARLASSQKFVLFDEEVNASAVGQADYKLVGSVTEFGRATSSQTGVFSKTKTQVARAAVSLRIVDARSGVVIFSTEGRGEAESTTGKVMGVGTSQGFDSTLSERAISAAISNVVGSIAERMLDDPWRSSVLDLSGSTCTIAGGRAQGLREGDRLVVLRRGRRVRNPQTNVEIELPGKQIAELVVRKCHGRGYADEFSECDVVTGDLAGVDMQQVAIQEPEQQ